MRRLFLRSRERAAALKRDKYSCRCCGVKQSRAKGRGVYVEVHHKKGVGWSGLIELVRVRLLQTPEEMETLCEDCHYKKEGDKKCRQKTV